MRGRRAVATLSKKNIDFTTGSIYKNLILFAIPIIAGEFFQNLYHSTDSLVLGNFAGEVALAAVSVNGTLTNLLIGFCSGMSVGSTVVVAKAFGSGDQKALKDSVCYTYTFGVFLGAALSVIGIVLAPYMVKLSNVNDEIYVQALTYLRIYIAGLVFTVTYNNTAGILRGMGDMRTPFYVLVISCSLNIILDLIFCGVLGWGISGVANATVMSQIVSVVISYYIIAKKLGFKCIDFTETFTKGKTVIGETLDIGVSAGFQSSLISFSNLFVWRYAFGSAVTTFTGQNIGANKQDRVPKGIKASIILAIGSVVFLGLIIYPLARPLAMLFNRNEEVIDTAVRMMHILIPLYFTNSIRQVLLGVLRAYKRSKISMILTLTGMVGVRQLYLAIAMGIKSDPLIIFIGYPVGWASAFLLILIYYLSCRKKLR